MRSRASVSGRAESRAFVESVFASDQDEGSIEGSFLQVRALHANGLSDSVNEIEGVHSVAQVSAAVPRRLRIERLPLAAKGLESRWYRAGNGETDVESFSCSAQRDSEAAVSLVRRETWLQGIDTQYEADDLVVQARFCAPFSDIEIPHREPVVCQLKCGITGSSQRGGRSPVSCQHGFEQGKCSPWFSGGEKQFGGPDAKRYVLSPRGVELQQLRECPGPLSVS